MLGVWTSEVGDNFAETLAGIDKPEMFHGTIDLIGSSDEEYESDVKLDEELATSRDDADDASQPEPEVTADDWLREIEVRDVIYDIVDFVERKVLMPEFGFDPDAMVKQEQIALREGSCMKPYCQMGCLCSSLRGAFQHVPTHCSKEGCMFECHCQARGLSALDDETHYADKSKRKKKIPNRFKDVVLGRAYKKLHARTIHDNSDDSDSDSDYETSLIPAFKKSPGSSPPKVPSPEPKKDGNGLGSKPDNSWINTDKIANIKRTIAERRVGFIANTIAEEQTLADVNIWCSQHNKYSCLCINYVYFSKTNYLLWKPSNKSRYLANKVMFDIMLKEPAHNEIPYEVFPYNRHNHCSRTFGSLLDYNVRNKDETYVSKRKLELEHNVLSYSNSYVKFRNFLLVKASEPVPSAEPFNRLSKKWSMGKVIQLVKTAEKGKVDVGEENLDVRVCYQIDDGNSEDDKAKVSGRKRKLTQKMKELEEERKREKEAEMEDIKRIEEEMRLRQAMEEVPAKVPKRRGRPPKVKVVDKVELCRLERQSVIERPSKALELRGEQTPEVEIPCKNGMKFPTTDVRIKQEPDASDYFKEAPAPVSSKALKDCLEKEFREDTPKPFHGFSDCDENSDLEDCDSIYSKKVLVLSPRSDGYPHMGLLCLTPGVGYVNVTESLRGTVVIADPINDRRRSFANLRLANDWLNRFFRSKVALSPPDLTLQWILATPGVLKLKQSQPVDPDMFQDDTVITPQGPVRRVANNCSLLRQQLSDHTVFRPLIKKQLALQDTSRWVPNPKYGKKSTPTYNTFTLRPLPNLTKILSNKLPPKPDCFPTS